METERAAARGARPRRGAKGRVAAGGGQQTGMGDLVYLFVWRVTVSEGTMETERTGHGGKVRAAA